MTSHDNGEVANGSNGDSRVMSDSGGENEFTATPAGDTVAAMAQAQTTISADEIALYDRQIRLWGVKAQEKLRTAHVLLITITALANEIAKNLVLAGIGSITLVDPDAITEEDLGAQFLVAEEDVGRNRAEAAAGRLQKLNPRVAVHVDTRDIRTKSSDFFSRFTIIIATSLDLSTLSQINEHTRRWKRPFYAADSHGFYGYIFSDLISHEYVIERERSNIPTTLKAETPTRSVIAVSTKKDNNGKVIEMVTKREKYCTLSEANAAGVPAEYTRNRRRQKQIPPLLTALKALWTFQSTHNSLPNPTSLTDLQTFTRLATEAHRELNLPPETLTSEFLTMFLQNIRSELAPVTAFLGGQLAQDVINVLGQREQPLQNWLLFDAGETRGVVLAMVPRAEEGNEGTNGEGQRKGEGMVVG